MSEENLPQAAWDRGKLPSHETIQRIPPRERQAYNEALREWLHEHDIKLAYEAWVLRDSVHAHVYIPNDEGRAHFIHSDDGTPHLGIGCCDDSRAREIATGHVDKPLLRQPPSPLG